MEQLPEPHRVKVHSNIIQGQVVDRIGHHSLQAGKQGRKKVGAHF